MAPVPLHLALLRRPEDGGERSEGEEGEDQLLRRHVQLHLQQLPADATCEDWGLADDHDAISEQIAVAPASAFAELSDTQTPQGVISLLPLRCPPLSSCRSFLLPSSCCVEGSVLGGFTPSGLVYGGGGITPPPP